jgi:hypothetical protein
LGGRLAKVAGMVALGCSGLFAGCSPSREVLETQARIEALRKDGEAIDQQLGQVEERLLGNQAKVMLWDELARRHQYVSALACRNHSTHMNEMLVNLERQTEKARRQRRSRRVASMQMDSHTVLTRSN